MNIKGLFGGHKGDSKILTFDVKRGDRNSGFCKFLRGRRLPNKLCYSLALRALAHPWASGLGDS